MSGDIDIVQRLEAELDDPQGHLVLSTTVDGDLLRDAIREIKRLSAYANDSDRLNDRMSDILHRTANALHGGPPKSGLWSWHDLPELAKEARCER